MSHTEETPFSRTALLLGPDSTKQIADSHVLVVGLGGVGGYVAELLARGGVGTLTIVDGDVVQPTNINRQIIALHSSIGRPKAQLWAERIRDINPDIHLTVLETFVRDSATDDLLTQSSYDFVVDAIDTLSPKVHLIRSLVEREIPFVSAMGAGAKVDPTAVHIARMDKVKNCTLARFIRKRLRKLGVPLHFTTVYSEELPSEEAIILTEGEQNKKSTAGTISYMPAIVGCYCAYVALDYLGQKRQSPHSTNTNPQP